MINNVNGWAGRVFVMTNEVNNRIVAFKRDHMGILSSPQSYQTMGNGTGVQMRDPLESQGSIVLSCDGRFLFTVNAGSNTISSFLVYQDQLVLIDAVPSGGIFPNSLAIIDQFLYVTNLGNATYASNVTGFHVRDGYLRPINNAQRLLSSPGAKPGCIVARGCGNKIIISEKATNHLSVFEVQCNGSLGGLVVNASYGKIPFGSAYLTNDLLLVSEAGPNALSSYRVGDNGILNVVTGSVLNDQILTCWIAVDLNERYAYTTNSDSGSVTCYRINPDGGLTVGESVLTTPTGKGGPIDCRIDPYGHYLYVLNGTEGAVSVFRIEQNGRLALLQICSDILLPQIGAQGLAVL